MPLDKAHKPKARLLHLDTIRGMALLGILLMNIQVFAAPILESAFSTQVPMDSLNRIAYFLLQIFVKGKFYILFSLLFGASFALIMQKSQALAEPDRWRFLRRLFILLCFGLVHGLFIWSGDILFIYAIVGFFLWLLFRHTPVSHLPKWAIYFIIQTIIPTWIFYVHHVWTGARQAGYLSHLSLGALSNTAAHQKLVDKARLVYEQGSYTEAIIQRWVDIELTFKASFWGLPTILGFFLIGAWLYRSTRLIEAEKHQDFFQRLAFWGLLLGLPLNIAATFLMVGESYFLQTLRTSLAFTLAEIGAPLLALAYLSLIVIYTPKLRFLQFLAPAGRMALTNYLLQSVFWTFFMYGYGLGMARKDFSLLSLTSFALIFFVIQVLLSRLWLKYFDFGPMEWIWRRLSHRKPVHIVEQV
ncbi:MAG: DUF418 domain-containing protein [Oligoflexus sp.]